MSCFIHKFVDGFGGMGDAVVCVKCGLDKYPEAIPMSVAKSKITGNYVENDGTYMHFQEYPYVRKFSSPIGYGTDHDMWTHFFNQSGKLEERVR